MYVPGCGSTRFHSKASSSRRLKRATAPHRRDLHVNDVAEAGKAGAQLVLCHTSAQAADEERGVGGVKVCSGNRQGKEDRVR